MRMHETNSNIKHCYCGKGKIEYITYYYGGKAVDGKRIYTCNKCHIVDIEKRIEDYYIDIDNIDNKLKLDKHRIEEDKKIYKARDMLKEVGYIKLPGWYKYKTKTEFYQELINCNILDMTLEEAKKVFRGVDNKDVFKQVCKLSMEDIKFIRKYYTSSTLEDSKNAYLRLIEEKKKEIEILKKDL